MYGEHTELGDCRRLTPLFTYYYNVFLITRFIFLNAFYTNQDNFIKKSSTRRNGEQTYHRNA
ncbi:hypothetical protein FS559_07355 [Treponema phagedenis]|nr:hypothetical protein FS559_07355 [Treponema phagedenis]